MKHDIYTVGVDIGGTNTHYAIVDNNGNIVASGNMRTTDYPYSNEFVDKLCDSIHNLIATSGTTGSIVGIGIGAPAVNSRRGCISGATDLPWRNDVPLVKLVEEKLGLPVVISNDANSAAAGEMIYGAAKGLSDFIVLTLGTGVGSGIVCDGILLNGSNGYAGELGHVRFPFAADRECGCGRKGCLETVASARGIVRTAQLLLKGTTVPSSLREIPEVTSKAIGLAAASGDALAMEIIRFTGECVGFACAEFAAMTDPQAIIIFGGVAPAMRLVKEDIENAMEKEVLHVYKGKVKILFSSLPDSDAAILGAASLPLAVGRGKNP